jgi:hypothetical protein
MTAEQHVDTPASAGTRGRRLIIVAVVLLVIVATSAQLFARRDRSVRETAVALSAVPSSDATDVTWYCAEGTSSPGGRADETLIIANLATTPARVTVVVHVAGTAKTREFSLLGETQQRVRVAEIAATTEPGVTVLAVGGQVVVEHALVGATDIAFGPCARRAAAEWYFAAGTTVKGAFEWLALYNPFAESATVDITVHTRDVTAESAVDRIDRIAGVNVPGATRVTVPIHDRIGRHTVTALQVRARIGRIVAERTLTFDGTDSRRGLASTLGAIAPVTTQVLAFGAAADGRAEAFAVLNPNDQPVSVTTSFVFAGGISVEPVVVTIPAQSVADVSLPTAPKDVPRIAVVESSRPVVAELRTAFAKAPAAGSVIALMGETTTANRWVFAAGAYSETSSDIYVVANRSQQEASVDVVSQGAVSTVSIPANAWTSVSAQQFQYRPSAAMVFSSTQPVQVVRITQVGSGYSVSPGMPAR